MKLIPKEIEKKLPKIHQAGDDPVCLVKLFNPTGAGTWWIAEKEGDTLFGVAEIFEREIGYFSLLELESLRLPYGLSIERDLHYTPKRISEIMKEGGF